MTGERRQQIARFFPNLEHDYAETSEETSTYNCIAWSMHDTGQWWDHTGRYGTYWPEGLPLNNRIETVILLFAAKGYTPCDSHEHEEGYEKIAIYELSGWGVQHIARQLQDGSWTSKLGEWEDIRHRSPLSVESDGYGRVSRYMKRIKPDSEN